MDVEPLLMASQNDAIRALVRALELHGPGEGDHAERVAVLSVATGDALELDDQDLLNLRRAATLHDVGKIAIDRELLSKMGELTEEDLDALRMHAAMCERVLADLPWLEPALPMIRHHHERWDGRGYPDGLAGEAIPLGARIIGVAETFDHLAYGSSYKIPMGRELAREVILEESGRQFDPAVVRAFLRVEPLVDPLIV